MDYLIVYNWEACESFLFIHELPWALCYSSVNLTNSLS